MTDKGHCIVCSNSCTCTCTIPAEERAVLHSTIEIEKNAFSSSKNGCKILGTSQRSK